MRDHEIKGSASKGREREWGGTKAVHLASLEMNHYTVPGFMLSKVTKGGKIHSSAVDTVTVHSNHKPRSFH